MNLQARFYWPTPFCGCCCTIWRLFLAMPRHYYLRPSFQAVSFLMPNICLYVLFPGPIAMVMDRNSIIPLAKGKGEQTQPMLYIRSAAGELVMYYSLKPTISWSLHQHAKLLHGQLAKIKWDPPPGDHLVCFKWTLQEQLVAVFEKGCVAVFDVHGHSVQRTFVLETSVREF